MTSCMLELCAIIVNACVCIVHKCTGVLMWMNSVVVKIYLILMLGSRTTQENGISCMGNISLSLLEMQMGRTARFKEKLKRRNISLLEFKQHIAMHEPKDIRLEDVWPLDTIFRGRRLNWASKAYLGIFDHWFVKFHNLQRFNKCILKRLVYYLICKLKFSLRAHQEWGRCVKWTSKVNLMSSWVQIDNWEKANLFKTENDHLKS